MKMNVVGFLFLLILSTSKTNAESGIFEILEPKAGITVTPGQTIDLIVQPSSSFTIKEMMVVYLGSIQILHPPWKGVITIPTIVSGKFSFTVVAKDHNNKLHEITRDLLVKHKAALKSLKLTPDSIYFEDDLKNHQISVEGLFDDNIFRELTKSETGTIYSSLNSGVANVNADGLVSSVDNGSTVITVTNGRVSANVKVKVDNLVDVKITQSFKPRDHRESSSNSNSTAIIVSIENLSQYRALDLVVKSNFLNGILFINAHGNGWRCEKSTQHGLSVVCSTKKLNGKEKSLLFLSIKENGMCKEIENQVILNTETSDPNVDNNINLLRVPCSA